VSDRAELAAVLRRLIELLNPDDHDSNDWSGHAPAELRFEISRSWMTSRQASPLATQGSAG
jgi:hypothetical protein